MKSWQGQNGSFEADKLFASFSLVMVFNFDEYLTTSFFPICVDLPVILNDGGYEAGSSGIKIFKTNMTVYKVYIFYTNQN